MDYRTLQYVIAVAEEKNISKAAHKLFISQPSLSHCILKQERRLGVSLFDRTKHPLQLTYAGERYVAAAHRILATREELQKEMEDIANTKKGRIVLGVTKPRSAYLLPKVVPRFKALYPNVELVLEEEISSTLESMLVAGRADAAILFMPIQSDSLTYAHLYDEEILLTLPEGHWAVERFVREGVDLRLLEGEPFILYKIGQRVRKASDVLFAEAGFSPRIVFESQVAETIAGLVSVGMGCAFVPKSVLESAGTALQTAGFALGEPPVHSSFAFAWRKDRYLSWSVQEFMKTVRDFLEGETQREAEDYRPPSQGAKLYERSFRKDFSPE